MSVNCCQRSFLLEPIYCLDWEERALSIHLIGGNWLLNNEAFPGVWGNRETRQFISGEQTSKNERKLGTMAILRNREHRKSRF